MPVFAITIHYSGLKAAYFQAHKQRSAGFPRAFLKNDIKALQMPLPRLVYLLNWDEPRVLCHWGSAEDAESSAVAQTQERFEAVRSDAALLGVLEISRIEVAQMIPLPESLIPGIPDTITFLCKRAALAVEDAPENATLGAKKARLGPSLQAVLQGIHAPAGAAFGKGSQTIGGARAPLAAVTNLHAGGALVGATPLGISTAGGRADRGSGQLSVKTEPQDDQPLEVAPMRPGHRPVAEPKVKLEGNQGVPCSLQDEARALRREIFETYDRDVQLLAYRKLLEHEVSAIQEQVECQEKENTNIRDDLIRRWKATHIRPCT